MYCKSVNQVELPDQTYIGIQTNNRVTIPFLDGQVIFEVDRWAEFINEPEMVTVRIEGGLATCQPRCR